MNHKRTHTSKRSRWLSALAVFAIAGGLLFTSMPVLATEEAAANESAPSASESAGPSASESAPAGDARSSSQSDGSSSGPSQSTPEGSEPPASSSLPEESESLPPSSEPSSSQPAGEEEEGVVGLQDEDIAEDEVMTQGDEAFVIVDVSSSFTVSPLGGGYSLSVAGTDDQGTSIAVGTELPMGTVLKLSGTGNNTTVQVKAGVGTAGAPLLLGTDGNVSMSNTGVPAFPCLQVQGTAAAVLAMGAGNHSFSTTHTGGYDGASAPLQVETGGALTIGTAAGVNDADAVLTAQSDHAAGIGGERIANSISKGCGTITIAGGTITATGGEESAGIGAGGNRVSSGSDTASGAEVNITGGIITATGIGGGYYNARNEGTSLSVSVTGGTIVEATGGKAGAGIGAGSYTGSGKNATIDITVGGSSEITLAQGGTSTAGAIGTGAGIGGGDYNLLGESSALRVHIAGGTIRQALGGLQLFPATNPSGGAGIGAGRRNGEGVGSIIDVKVTGGTIEEARGQDAAGIGGGDMNSRAAGTKITVSVGGGTIHKALGTGGGAGIGTSSFSGNGEGFTGLVDIYGGTIHLASGNNNPGGAGGGAGIGAGSVTATGKNATFTVKVRGNADIREAIGGSNGAGIGGGTYTADGEGSKLLVEVGGGKIGKAQGSVKAATPHRDGGAGIGAGPASAATGGTGASVEVNILGGTIGEAIGGGGAAGIGGGYNSLRSAGCSLTVNVKGGTIGSVQGGENGPGIGVGSHSLAAENTTATIEILDTATIGSITGGKNGAGIGSGTDCLSGLNSIPQPDNASINIILRKSGLSPVGGEGAAGIGGGARNGLNKDTTLNITIPQGVTVASATGGAGGAGIGGGSQNRDIAVQIDGGRIQKAQGGSLAAGIGGGSGNAPTAANRVSVLIRGGTLQARGGTGAPADLGAGDGNSNPPALSIVGGSVDARNASHAPVNGQGLPVYLNTLDFETPALSRKVSEGSINEVPVAAASASATGTAYGVQDVYTDASGQLYFWLAATTTRQDVELRAQGATGWFSNYYVRPAANQTAVTTLYAPRAVQVFHQNGAAGPQVTEHVKYGHDIAAATLAQPTHGSRRFQGWYAAASGGSPYAGSQFQNITAPLDIYAQWLGALWNISYTNAKGISGVTGMPNGAQVETGLQYNVEKGQPKRTGHDFVGWKRRDDGKTYLPGVSFLMPDSDVTLVSTWEKLKYNVVFKYGDARQDGHQKVAYEEKAARPADPGMNGYTFKHWQMGNGQAYDFGTLVTSHLTLYAVWEPNTTPPPSSSSSSSSSRDPGPVSSQPSSSSSPSAASSSQAPVPTSAPPPAEPPAPTAGTGTPANEPPPSAPQHPPEVQARLDAQSGNPIVDIMNGNVPLGSIGYAHAWSLLSLMAAVAALFSTFLRILLSINQRRRGIGGEGQRSRTAFILSVAGIILGFFPGFFFLILDDLTNPMVWVNRYTPLILVLLAAHLVLAHFLGRRRYVSKDDSDSPEGSEVFTT